MLNLGMVRPGTTIVIPFHTFDSNDPSASVTITGLATTDIEVYKDGSNTTRDSDTGYALLGTNGIDEFGTGVHGISIDLASNATVNFFEAGSSYFCVIASITVDAGVVNFVAATWEIGYPGAMVNTTIATLASQTGFTLEDASAEADAYNGCTVIIHDLASAVQLATGVISDYAVTSKTVTLAADPGIFTMAAGDSISIFPPVNVLSIGAVVQAGDGSNLTETGGDGAQLTEAGSDGDHLTAINLPNQTMDITGTITTVTTVTNQHTLAEINTEVDNSMVTYGLDHLISAAVAGADVADNSIIADLVSKEATADYDDFVNTTDSLQAIRDHATTIKTDTGAILTDTGTAGVIIAASGFPVGGYAAGAITAASIAANAIGSSELANDAISAAVLSAAAVNKIWDDVIEAEDSITAQEALSLCLAVLAGETSSGGDIIATPDGVATRVTATIDGSQNRTGMVLNKSAHP